MQPLFQERLHKPKAYEFTHERSNRWRFEKNQTEATDNYQGNKCRLKEHGRTDGRIEGRTDGKDKQTSLLDRQTAEGTNSD